MLHWRTMLLVTVLSGGCLITAPTSFVSEAPVTPPRILDVQGVTRPRLGNLIVLTDGDPDLRFDVPVQDDNVTDDLQYQFILNGNRDCVPIAGGASCEPDFRLGVLGADGRAVRNVQLVLQTNRFRLGCNRVELWVSSAFEQRKSLAGNFHIPVRPGDVDFATWWVFLRARPGSGSEDGGAVDPVERCGYLVQP